MSAFYDLVGYFRIFGTFESLKGGNMAEALEDFTGGLTEPYELNNAPPHLFHVNKAARFSPILNCSYQ